MKRRTGVAGALIAALLATFAVVLPATVAGADEPTTGTIVVTVTAMSSGQPVSGICLDVENGAAEIVATSCDAVAGVFTVTGVAPGSYKIRAYGAYGQMWSGPASSRATASEIVVEADATTELAIPLLTTGQNGGYVVDANGDPVAGATVEVWWTNSRSVYVTRTTGADGSFVANMLCTVSSPCRVSVSSPDHAREFFPDGSDASAAHSFEGADGPWLGTLVLDLANGAIAGAIEPPLFLNSATPCVILYEKWTSGDITQQLRSGTEVCGPTGTPFSFSNLPPTTYFACYVAGPTYYNCWSVPVRNTLGTDAAPMPIVVSSGETRSVPDFGMPLTISGQISSGGGPVQYVNSGCVDVYEMTTTTKVQSICEPGDALYQFTLPDDSRTYGAFGWGFADRSDGWISKSITGVDGVPVPSLSLSVLSAPWGSISGTITLPSGTSATHGCVMAFDESKRYTSSDYFQEACANPVTGAYQLALPAGRYKLQFYIHGVDVATEWNDNARSGAAAPYVTVSSGPATTVVNATLERAGYIAATVTGAAGAPVDGACVSVILLSGQFLDTRCADSSGQVLLDSRSAGSYRLYLEPGANYPGRWFGGSGLLATASSYTVVAGATVNATVSVAGAGTIQGTVTDPGGSPAVGGCVEVYEADSVEFVGQTCSAPDGTFAVPVMPGEYLVLYSDWSSQSDSALLDAWFGGATIADAQAIQVLSGGTATADRQLGAAVRVSVATRATTLEANTAPAYGGCVNAYTTMGVWVAGRCSQDEATDTLEFHLAPGNYEFYASNFVHFAGNSFPRLRIPLHEPLEGAVSYTVPAGVAGSVVIQMQPGPELVGTVNVVGTRATGGFVDVFGGAGGFDYITTVRVSETGTFTARGLGWGDEVRVYFHGVPGAANQYQDQSASLGVADSISMPSAPSPDQVDVRQTFNLIRGGTVSARLLAPSYLVPGGELCLVLYALVDNWYYPAHEECGERGSNLVISGVLPGIYAVEYVGDGGQSSWWNTSGEWGTTESQITVTTGATTTVVPKVVELSGPSTIVAGQALTMDITVFPPVTVKPLHTMFCLGEPFSTPSPTCTYSQSGLPSIVNGAGKWVVTARDSGWYEVGLPWPYGSRNQHYVEVITPLMTLAGETSPQPNDQVTFSLTSNMDFTATGTVWTRPPNGAWAKTTQTVSIVDGDATFTATATWSAREYRVHVGSVMSLPITVNPQVPTVSRVGGATRYDVAVGISQQYFPDGADTVYIATGANFPDALGAAPAAALRDAPLLLVPGTSIPQSIQDELDRLDPDHIIVTGGPASVSEGVLAQLHDFAMIVTRINGPDRYEVSRRVTRDAFAGENPSIAYVATGVTFPDALSASAAAGTLEAPVILVYGKATTLDQATSDLLEDLGVTEVRIAGGPASVSPGIEAALRNVPGVTTVTRTGGADRFVVSGATNRAVFSSSDTVFIASGMNFPDALSGAAVAGKIGAPLYVIPGTCIPGYVLDDIASFGATKVQIFGGPASVTPAAAAFARC